MWNACSAEVVDDVAGGRDDERAEVDGADVGQVDLGASHHDRTADAVVADRQHELVVRDVPLIDHRVRGTCVLRGVDRQLERSVVQPTVEQDHRSTPRTARDRKAQLGHGRGMRGRIERRASRHTTAGGRDRRPGANRKPVIPHPAAAATFTHASPTVPASGPRAVPPTTTSSIACRLACVVGRPSDLYRDPTRRSSTGRYERTERSCVLHGHALPGEKAGRGGQCRRGNREPLRSRPGRAKRTASAGPASTARAFDRLTTRSPSPANQLATRAWSSIAAYSRSCSVPPFRRTGGRESIRFSTQPMSSSATCAPVREDQPRPCASGAVDVMRPAGHAEQLGPEEHDRGRSSADELGARQHAPHGQSRWPRTRMVWRVTPEARRPGRVSPTSRSPARTMCLHTTDRRRGRAGGHCR